MKNRTLIPMVTIVMMVLFGLACGSTRITTEHTATSTPSASKPSTPKPSPKPSTPKPSLKPSTPEPSPKPQPQIDLQAGSYTNYRDIINTLWFVGEVLNKGNAPAESVQVVLSLLDSSGNVVAIGSDTILYIDSEGKFPYKIMVDKAPKEWAEVKIQIQGQPLTDQSFFAPYLDLKIDKVTGQPSEYGGYSLTGMVINSGQKTAMLVHIVAVAYDVDGKVIDVGDTFASLNELAPGGNSPFSLDFGNIKDAPASYEIYAQSSLTK